MPLNMITLFRNYERFIVFCQESRVQVECITYAGKIVYGQLCDYAMNRVSLICIREP